MSRKKEKISSKQELAIVSLLSCSTISAAAKTAGVSEKTIRRWLRDEAFSEEYRLARRQIFSQAMGRLQKLTGPAVGLLGIVVGDGQTRSSVRITACRTILENAIKGIELDDMAARLDRLEKMLHELQTKNQ